MRIAIELTTARLKALKLPPAVFEVCDTHNRARKRATRVCDVLPHWVDAVAGRVSADTLRDALVMPARLWWVLNRSERWIAYRATYEATQMEAAREND